MPYFYGKFTSFNGDTFDKRSQLIISKNCLSENEFDTVPFDAVAILMNPGSALPLDESDLCREKEGLFIPIFPDPTQYQLMHIMDTKNWNTLCVINLSDKIGSDSSVFLKWVKDNKNNEQILKQWSIFGDDSTSNLTSIMNRTERIICAWGQNTELKYLIDFAWIKVTSLKKDIKGIQSGQGNHLYQHPYSQATETRWRWYKDMLSQLR
ncbi:MAG: DUF1643 domain-containing protein [Fibrobacteraceae bacterium]|nr:DUF1643 domain-containing protein [Fibrobacteraceae bacterium]